MFEEPVQLPAGRVPQRPLGAGFAVRRPHLRQPGAGQALRHARADKRRRRLGACRRRRPLRPRRAAAHGGVPDQERARPAHQPGQARLLGGEERARRAHPAAARRGARAAARRGQAGPAPARVAGQAPRGRRLRRLPRPLRRPGPGVRGLRPHRRAAHPGPGRPPGGPEGDLPRRQRGRGARRPAGVPARQAPGRLRGQPVPASCWPSASAARWCCPTSRRWPR